MSSLLPFRPAPESNTTPRTSVDAAGAEPLRILVVDDNRDAANSMALLLRLLGHEVQVAADGGGERRRCDDDGCANRTRHLLSPERRRAK